MKLKKTTLGNYSGYYKSYHVFIFMRPHGAWCCQITKKGKIYFGEGYFTTSLPTVGKAKEYVKKKLG